MGVWARDEHSQSGLTRRVLVRRSAALVAVAGLGGTRNASAAPVRQTRLRRQRAAALAAIAGAAAHCSADAAATPEATLARLQVRIRGFSPAQRDDLHRTLDFLERQGARNMTSPQFVRRIRDWKRLTHSIPPSTTVDGPSVVETVRFLMAVGVSSDEASAAGHDDRLPCLDLGA